MENMVSNLAAGKLFIGLFFVPRSHTHTHTHSPSLTLSLVHVLVHFRTRARVCACVNAFMRVGVRECKKVSRIFTK